MRRTPISAFELGGETLWRANGTLGITETNGELKKTSCLLRPFTA